MLKHGGGMMAGSKFGSMNFFGKLNTKPGAKSDYKFPV